MERVRSTLLRRAARLGVARRQLEAKNGRSIQLMNAEELIDIAAAIRVVEDGLASAATVFAPWTKQGAATARARAFARRLRAAWTWEEGLLAGREVAKATASGAITNAQAQALRLTFRNYVLPLKPPNSPVIG